MVRDVKLVTDWMMVMAMVILSIYFVNAGSVFWAIVGVAGILFWTLSIFFSLME